MDKTNLSVSMCVYGRDNANHFDIALESVVYQTLKPSEIILVVDGPIPQKINDVIGKYKEICLSKKISFKIYRYKTNKGHGTARRLSFEKCTHDYIALMDADDLSTPNRFKIEMQAFEKDQSLSIVGSHVSEFVGNPENITARRLVKLEDKDIKKDLKKRCPMNQPTVMFKKKDVAEVGGYIDWFCNEDYYLWIRLAKAGKKFRNIDSCLVNMRVDENSYQRRGGWKYFSSEAKLQKLMLDDRMIRINEYLINVCKRFIVQVCLPNKVRGWVFKQFARN